MNKETVRSAGVQFYVRKSSASGCIATAIHQSGKEPLAIGVGDPLYSGDVTAVAGVISDVAAVHATPTMWFYQVRYQPAQTASDGSSVGHALGSSLRFFGRIISDRSTETTGQVTGRAAGKPASLLAATA